MLLSPRIREEVFFWLKTSLLLVGYLYQLSTFSVFRLLFSIRQLPQIWLPFFDFQPKSLERNSLFAFLTVVLFFLQKEQVGIAKNKAKVNTRKKQLKFNQKETTQEEITEQEAKAAHIRYVLVLNCATIPNLLLHFKSQFCGVSWFVLLLFRVECSNKINFPCILHFDNISW